jgi:HEAT repeat protein
MAGSSSAEERYLSWHAYTEAIAQQRLAVPRRFDATIACCRKEKNRYVQAQIMAFLGACEAREAIPLLVAALNDDPHYSAVQALGAIRDPKTVPAILACAKKEKRNRHIYSGVLGRIGSPEAVDYLLEHLHEGCFAVEALFESGSSKALPALEDHLARLKKLKEPDELDLAVTQVSVLRLKSKDPRQQLVALGEDARESRWMRTNALQALSHYDKRPFASRILKLYQKDRDEWVRMDCIRLLQDLPGNDITEAMVDQALTDNENRWYASHDHLREALNQRLGTSFRSLTPLIEHLKSERNLKEKRSTAADVISR